MRRVNVAEARFLYGAALLALAKSRRSPNPLAVDVAAVTDMWRASASFSLAESMLKAAAKVANGMPKMKKIKGSGTCSAVQFVRWVRLSGVGI